MESLKREGNGSEKRMDNDEGRNKRIREEQIYVGKRDFEILAFASLSAILIASFANEQNAWAYFIIGFLVTLWILAFAKPVLKLVEEVRPVFGFFALITGLWIVFGAKQLPYIFSLNPPLMAFGLILTGLLMMFYE